jgi:hypothetical protein
MASATASVSSWTWVIWKTSSQGPGAGSSRMDPGVTSALMLGWDVLISLRPVRNGCYRPVCGSLILKEAPRPAGYDNVPLSAHAAGPTWLLHVTRGHQMTARAFEAALRGRQRSTAALREFHFSFRRGPCHRRSKTSEVPTLCDYNSGRIRPWPLSFPESFGLDRK